MDEEPYDLAAFAKSLAEFGFDSEWRERPVTGFFASLTDEQQRRALAYRGPDSFGDPKPSTEHQMPKYRSREIVEAEQWFPGKEIAGVVETKDESIAILRYSDGKCLLIRPGDYIVTYSGYNDFRYSRIESAEHFEREYENIGG
jgi:hypothetical protein